MKHILFSHFGFVHRRRNFFLLSAFSLCVLSAALSGCADPAVPESAAEDVPVIRMGMYGVSSSAENVARVNKALGDYTEETYGFRLEMITDSEDISNDFVFYDDADTPIDLAAFSYEEYDRYAQKGLLMDMSSYLPSCGQDLQEVRNSKAPDAESRNGAVYGIPKYYSDIHYAGALLSTYYVEKYDMDLDSIHTPTDLEPYLEMIAENEPDVIPWAKSSSTPDPLKRLVLGDVLDGLLSMVEYDDDSLTVKNIYETEAYEERVRMMQRWYEKGYLQKDILTNGEYGLSLLLNNRAFAVESVIRPDETQYLLAMYPEKLSYIVFDQTPLIDTECDWVYVWAISSSATCPREAVTALNAIYSDEKVSTLIQYGMEGEDYVTGSDGHIDFPEDKERSDCYYTSYKYHFNQLNAPLWSGMDTNISEEMAEMKAAAEVSPAYGFWFDDSDLSVDREAIEEVIDKYSEKLSCGVCDVDTVLPEFRQELKEAGADELVKEVQKQLNAWANKQREE